MKLYYPSMKLCTDNAAMIAQAAYYKIFNARNLGDETKSYAALDLNAIASLTLTNDI